MTKTAKAGVIGAGSFGTTIACLLAKNQDVLLYVRNAEQSQLINETHTIRSHPLPENIQATTNPKVFCEYTSLIFPAVPSRNFGDMVQTFSSYFRPYHILIHCTKGFDLGQIREEDVSKQPISRNQIRTMSEVILQESVVKRVGCLSGPNLAKEILEGKPTASVIASSYDEVIEVGQQALNSNRFFVFGSHDIIGAELAGAFKNIIALGTGILAGMNMGKNLEAMLITRGLREMIYIGRAMGADSRAFLGTAGIGDLIATATSSKSRNFSVGYRLGQGEPLANILEDMDEVAEGIRTLRIAQQLTQYYDISAPIIRMLYKVIFQDHDIHTAISFLMSYPFAPDVDFL